MTLSQPICGTWGAKIWVWQSQNPYTHVSVGIEYDVMMPDVLSVNSTDLPLYTSYKEQSPLLIRSIQWLGFIIVLLFWFCILMHGHMLSYCSFHLEEYSVSIWLSCVVLSSSVTIQAQWFSFFGVIMISPSECVLIWILVHMVFSRAGAVAGKYDSFGNMPEKYALPKCIAPIFCSMSIAAGKVTTQGWNIRDLFCSWWLLRVEIKHHSQISVWCDDL